MKKCLIFIFIFIMMVATLAACDKKGSTANTDNKESTNQTEQSSKENKEAAVGKITNEDGEEFTVDTTATGEIKNDAEPISSNKISLGDKTYAFPMKMSELMADGWSLSEGYEYENEFEPNTTTNLISYNLKSSDGTEIMLDQVRNDSTTVKGIEDCVLTGFHIDEYYFSENFDFVLPGGITKDSTAADVLSVFGDPNKTSDFKGYSYNLDDQLTYDQHSVSNICYSFTFYEDGTLSGIYIDYVK